MIMAEIHKYVRTLCFTLIAILSVCSGRRSQTGDGGFIVSRKIFYSENIGKTLNIVSSMMSTACKKSEMVVTFEAERMKSLGIAHHQLKLKDTECFGSNNGTHYVLRVDFSTQHKNSCGSDIVDGEVTKISNHVKIEPLPALTSGLFSTNNDDDDDFNLSGEEGSGGDEDALAITLPFQCEYNTKATTHAVPVRRNTTTLQQQSHRFDLNVYTSETFLTPLPDITLGVKQGKPLYVEVVPLQTSMLRHFFLYACNLTSFNGESYPLIQNGCAVDTTLKFVDEIHIDREYRRFKFNIGRVFESMVTLKCSVEPCSTLRTRYDNLPTCAPQTDYCIASSSTDRLGSQETRLLLNLNWDQYVTVLEEEYKEVDVDLSSSSIDDLVKSNQRLVCPPTRETTRLECECADNIHDPLSVSLAVTLIVSALSFIMGATLVVGIWCVYVRTDPRRKMQPVSMSETGSHNTSSSQSPIQIRDHKPDMLASFGR